MISEMQKFKGKVITACRPVEPEALGKVVMMHEHFSACAASLSGLGGSVTRPV